MRKKNYYDYEDKEESFSPWKSYSDLFCGLLLVFALLFFFSIYQYITAKEANEVEQATVLAMYKAENEDQEEELQKKKDDLDAQAVIISSREAELKEKDEEIAQQLIVIAQKELELSDKDEEIASKQAVIDLREKEVNEKNDEIAGQDLELSAREAEIESQLIIISEKEKELKTKDAQITSLQEALEGQALQLESIIGIRQKLIEDLNREMQKNNIKVEADKTTGAIVFPSNVLFEVDSNALSNSGKEFIRTFMPVYLGVLFQPEYKENLAEIIVEGHTDNTGTYMHNLELSERRAHSVAEFCVQDNCDFLDMDTIKELRSYITVNGCAYKSPILAADGTMDMDKSRRVEIKFRLRDEEMIEAMDSILNSDTEY